MAVTAWKILGVIAALLILLCLLRGGVIVEMKKTLTVRLRIGPFRFCVYPTNKKKAPEKKEGSEEKAAAAMEKKAFPKPALADIRDAVKTLWLPLKRALDRTRRGVRIDPLDVSVLLGGAAEPADAAQLYGKLHGAIWAGMPVLEQILVIPHPHIHLDVDFTAEETTVDGTVGLSARIGTLLRIGLALAIPALRWLLAYMKKKRTPVRKDDFDGNGKEKPAA